MPLNFRLFVAALVASLCGATLAHAAASAAGGSADGLWQETAESNIVPQQSRQIVPEMYRTLTLNRSALLSLLANAPLEALQPVTSSPMTLSIPLPYNKFGNFRIVESPIMAPALAQKYPQIKTYLGQGIDDPTATLRFDVTPEGFHAQILSSEGTVYVDPYQGGDDVHYIAYAKEDYRRSSAPMVCQVHGKNEAAPMSSVAQPDIVSGDKLRTYRLALSATGEYTQTHGGTVNGALGGMVSTLNRVNGIYEHDLAVRMVLVADTDKLIYLNGATDPFTNDDGSVLLDENQSVVDATIGNANYDVGHIFSTGGGGIAGLGVVCATGQKGGGVTGLPNPVADGYDIDFVAHEMGHQFGGNHTFNSTSNNCGGGNRNASTAYEAGSGVTIMGYAGICSPEDLQPHSEDYFHRASLNEILANITTGTASACPVVTSTGNTAPTVSVAGALFTIPRSTPFVLSGSGSDANGDTLSYVWEQFNLGSASSGGTLADSGNRPLFRSFDPLPVPVRIFPSLRYILNNANLVPAQTPMPGTASPNFYAGELLPTAAHTGSTAMVFRLTARDNRAGGGATNEGTTTVNVVAAAGPFAVTSPNTAVSWNTGSPQTVTWNVAGTDANGITTANVRITLSLDGGYTWPVELAASVPNNGSANVTVPAGTLATAQARVRVEAIGNIFFDVSDVNFAIVGTGGQSAPTITLSGTGHVAVRQGASVTGAVATVTDAQDLPAALGVSATSDFPELIVSAVNNAGTINLTAQAACTLVSPTSGSKAYPVKITVTDTQGGTTAALVYVDVSANRAPTLGNYTNQQMLRSATTNVSPSAAAADPDGTTPTFSVTPTTLPGGGTLSISGSGTVTVNTAAATTFGTHKVRALATDSCGYSAVSQFNVQVVSPDPILSLNNKTVTSGNNLIEPNECNDATLTLGNSADTLATATGISGSLTSSTPGVTIAPASSAYGDIAPNASGVNLNAYRISTDNTVACFSNIAFTQTVGYTQNGSPAVFNFTLPVGRAATSNYSFTSSSGNTIPAGGVLASGSQVDDGTVTVNVPFALTAYSTTVNAGSPITISTNGLVFFAGSGTDDWGNAPLPASALSGGASGSFPATAPTLFAYWDDIDMTGAGRGIFTQTTGVAPNRSFIIEWKGVLVSDNAVTVDFAAVFHEGNNQFEYVYANAAGASGASATIGAQLGNSGPTFTQQSYNTAGIASGTKLSAVILPALCNAGTGVCPVWTDLIFKDGFQ